jgi:hypothetical protein
LPKLNEHCSDDDVEEKGADEALWGKERILVTVGNRLPCEAVSLSARRSPALRLLRLYSSTAAGVVDRRR